MWNTGAGEYIVRAALARRMGDVVTSDRDTHDVLEQVLRETSNWDGHGAGVLVLVRHGLAAKLWCAFTTESMAISYGRSGGQTKVDSAHAKRSMC